MDWLIENIIIVTYVVIGIFGVCLLLGIYISRK